MCIMCSWSIWVKSARMLCIDVSLNSHVQWWGRKLATHGEKHKMCHLKQVGDYILHKLSWPARLLVTTRFIEHWCKMCVNQYALYLSYYHLCVKEIWCLLCSNVLQARLLYLYGLKKGLVFSYTGLYGHTWSLFHVTLCPLTTKSALLKCIHNVSTQNLVCMLTFCICELLKSCVCRCARTCAIRQYAMHTLDGTLVKYVSNYALWVIACS